ncbi:TfoX/Sxy family protein [Bradyrhizobium sp. SRS-191]|uniref:TfoX/Sxy family protein n=1 Tax=Bradyrhizobium sp. SRS-191 TaxID=2962606 RepID=UPI00211EE626|nr:TfoX/Sxy family protein [Bradyrhizobium sp. SRS-191]
MVATPDYVEFLREQFAPLGAIRTRRMFGKTGLFIDGAMLGMVADNTLYFRVDDGNRSSFAEAQTAPPLSYTKQGVSIDLAFWRAPDRLFDDPEDFASWARLALAAARRVMAKRDGTRGPVRSRTRNV